ncbi:MAG TPA: isochorismatase family cysteine hydrolase [Burkholderiaceae bacterium]|nr:isochorismatase family cysteine hydrolase [Burkholderiaceae bacterium]
MMPDRQGGAKSAPHSSKVALLIIDMISDFEFADGQRLFRHALPAAGNILRLKKRADAARIPTIYVNDNFGQWRSDFRQIVQRCLNEPVRGKPIARMLAPADEDYFVLKPANSGFFSTPLRTLLQLIGVETLLLTGVTSNQCVLFTAADAYVRNYRLVVPRDCVAAINTKANELSLKYFESVLKADVRSSSRIRLSRSPSRRNRKGASSVKQ